MEHLDCTHSTDAAEFKKMVEFHPLKVGMVLCNMVKFTEIENYMNGIILHVQLLKMLHIPLSWCNEVPQTSQKIFTLKKWSMTVFILFQN